MAMKERQMPNSIEAERAVLGSLLIDPSCISLIADRLKPDHFYRDAHCTLYKTMLSLYEKEIPGDLITIYDTLERAHKADEISFGAESGMLYLVSLSREVPTSANAEYYADIVIASAIRRRLIKAGSDIVTAAYEQDDADQAVQQAESLIYGINQDQHRSDFSSDTEIIDAYLTKLWAKRGNNTDDAGLKTHLTDLDNLLGGGFQNSDLIILAARPAVGKSSLMLTIANNVVQKSDKRVAIFSLEMGKEQLIQRLISQHAHIDSARVRRFQIYEDEWERLVEVRDVIARDQMWIDDTAGISLSALRSKLRRLHAKRPVDLLIVDYVQLMSGDPNASRKDSNRVQELGQITMGLKNIAKELNIPVLALAQLSRAVEQRQDKIPQMSDLRESGSLENDADIVMFIYRDEVYHPDTERKGQADIVIAKHRNGPTGEVVLGFRQQETWFHNLYQGEENN